MTASKATRAALLLCSVSCLWVALAAGPVSATDDILSFYSKAATITDDPVPRPELRIVCQKQIDPAYVSFMSFGSGKVMVAAVTVAPLSDPAHNPFLRHYIMKVSTLPLLSRGRELERTVYYTFDRNQDGKIDYLCVDLGPSPIEGPDFPADFPKASGGKVRLTGDQIQYLMSRTALVFRHCADDNFDGAVDAGVIEEGDQDRPGFVKGFQLLRSSKFDGTVDQSWYFTNNIRAPARDAERSGRGFFTTGVPGREFFDHFKFDERTKGLSLLNQAARACGFGRGSFASSP